MDEIDLATRTRQAQDSGETIPTDPSASVPVELRGLTAVASEAGTIDATIAGKDVKKALEAMDDFDVVDSAMTVTEKEGEAQLKFRYGRNTAAEIEAGAKGVEKASRKTGETKHSRKSVKIDHPKQSKNARGKHPETATGRHTSAEEYEGRGYASDSDIRPHIRPKSALRTASYGATTTRDHITQNNRVSMTSSVDFDIPDYRKRDFETEALSSSLEHDPPSSNEENNLKVSAMIPRTPTLPTYHDLQTKSNPELAAQLIARALRVDFVYFMRLTPITAKHPNITSYFNAEVNMELLGSFGLPFAEISFSPFLHLEALRSELGMMYHNDTGGDGNESDNNSVINARDFYRVGLVVPVWREYPRSSLASSTTSTTARAGSPRGSTGGQASTDRSSFGTNTTISSLRGQCRKGVVVGVFSKRGPRRTFTRDEREYLKQWISLRDHL